MTLLQARVYFAIRDLGPIGPTQIGHHLDRRYEVAAAHVSRPIKRLIELGLIERIETNKRVVRFRILGNTPPFHIRADETDPVYIRLKQHENL